MGGAACSACENCEANIESDTRDQMLRDVNDEMNGDEGYVRKPIEEGDSPVVLLGSSAWRDGGRKNTRHPSAVERWSPRCEAIPEDKQQSSMRAKMTPRVPPEPATPGSAPTHLPANSIGSNSPVYGSPRCRVSRWPSQSSIPSNMSGQELSRPWLQALSRRFPISSYAVSDEPVKQLSRHIAFAPSPTHSVHQSEHSVMAYGEIYGDHPMTFEFDAAGNKVPLPERDQEVGTGKSPRSYIETVRGIQVLGKGQEPMGPAGAIRYN